MHMQFLAGMCGPGAVSLQVPLPLLQFSSLICRDDSLPTEAETRSILSERFNQDPLESFFGQQCARRGRIDVLHWTNLSPSALGHGAL